MSSTKQLAANHRRDLLRQQGGVCHYCSVPLSLELVTLDHIVPRAFGGPTMLWNLVASCADCNGDLGHAVMKCRCGRCVAAVDRCLKTRKKILAHLPPQPITPTPSHKAPSRSVQQVLDMLVSRELKLRRRLYQSAGPDTHEDAARRGAANAFRQAITLLASVTDESPKERTKP